MSIDTPERLETTSLDIAGDRIAKLREDFPEVFRDGRIDFDTLKRSLGEWIEPEGERFGLQWPGKAAAFQAVQTPSVGTLLPDPDNSVDWDSTENLIIEGDNLEVLKLLQKSYYGKVKMIYIDPPYNTGNDFIYPDNYREGMQSYLEFTGQVNAEGKKLATNTETGGRYHSNWLNMMYPRLYLAKNLLRDDGVLFVSISDEELSNLMALMNEILGEENRVSCFVVTRSEGGGLAKHVVKGHDYLLAYARNIDSYIPLKRPKDIRGKTVDIEGIAYWIEEDWLRKEFGAYGTCHYEEIIKYKGDTKKKEIDLGIRQGTYVLLPKSNGLHIVGRYRQIASDGSKFYSVMKHLNKNGVADLESINFSEVFDYPKPLSLIQDITSGATFTSKTQEDIVLDFFAGSGTTAHAVMQQNAEDGGNRKYILVQLPEPIDPPKRLDDGTTLSTIADITRERVRRAGQKIAAEGRPAGGKPRVDMESTPTRGTTQRGRVDVGFRSYRLATSNFKPWDGTPPGEKQASMNVGVSAPDPARQIAMQLEAFTDNVLPGRTQEDILAEIMLRMGRELTTPVEALTLAGCRVFSIDNGAVLACLEPSLSLDLFEAMAEMGPGQIVCLDSAFGDDDELKVNATQIIKSRARSEEATIKLWVV